MKQRFKPLNAITRRSVIKASVATAGTLLLGCGPRGCHRSSPVSLEKRKADVVVVGAGLSGLMAARELVKEGVESVLVLEARSRVGGLTLSQPIADGVMVDGGGEWVNPAHKRLLALARELAVPTMTPYGAGVSVFYFDEARSSGFKNLFTREERDEVEHLNASLEAMALELPLDAPWDAPRAAEYDAHTMFSWLKDNTRTTWGRRTIELAINFTFGVQPEDISLLCFLAAVRGCGGVDALVAVSDSEDQDEAFVGGSQELSVKMAEALGDRVILSSPVVRIVDDPSGPVRVETDRLAIEANRVIVAMMPADTRRIEFEPELPERRRALVKRWTGMSDYKVHVIYKKPFWRELGMSGTAVGDGKVVDFVFDSSPSPGLPGVLVAFGAGEELPSDLDSRKEMVTLALAAFFGKEALEPTGFIEMDWMSEKWSSGCASPLKPGVLSAYGPALREPVRRVHWAGSDTSAIWSGFMEGAVRSGERVAAEVVAALRESGVPVPPARRG